jgi:hypothetical protein
MLHVDIFRERHLAEWIFRIWRRSARFGTPIVISRSKRPGRRGPGRRVPAFRGADDHDLPAETRPSISARSCATTRFHVSDDIGPFRGGGVHLVEEDDAGSSSGPRRIPAGAWLRSPVELVDELRAVDVDEMGPPSLEMARDEGLPFPAARKSTPLGGSIPSSVNRSGNFSGSRSSPDVAQLFLQAADVFVGVLTAFRGRNRRSGR